MKPASEQSCDELGRSGKKSERTRRLLGSARWGLLTAAVAVALLFVLTWQLLVHETQEAPIPPRQTALETVEGPAVAQRPAHAGLRQPEPDPEPAPPERDPEPVRHEEPVAAPEPPRRPEPTVERGGGGALEPALSGYEEAAGLGGRLNAVGSDSMQELMVRWGRAFEAHHPTVRVQVEGKGSATAPPALISGLAHLGPMSRAMKDKELAAFEKVFGYPPTKIAVAVDGLAVWVHKDSPLEKLTMAQLDAVFSKTRKAKFAEDITSWAALGGSEGPVRLYGRDAASGTQAFFESVALLKGDYKDTVMAQPSSAAVVQRVAEDRSGIGYSGIGHRTDGVKTVALAKVTGGPFYSPDNMEHVLSGKYPLSRYLYVYVNKAPGKALDPVVLALITYVLSKEGQEAVVDDGYYPLNQMVAAKQLSLVR